MQQIFPELLARCLVVLGIGQGTQEEEKAGLSMVLWPSSQGQGKTECPRKGSFLNIISAANVTIPRNNMTSPPGPRGLPPVRYHPHPDC